MCKEWSISGALFDLRALRAGEVLSPKPPITTRKLKPFQLRYVEENQRKMASPFAYCRGVGVSGDITNRPVLPDSGELPKFRITSW